jgi:hypothetical protein
MIAFTTKQIAVAGFVLSVFGFVMSSMHQNKIENWYKLPKNSNMHSLIHEDSNDRSYGAKLQPSFKIDHLRTNQQRSDKNDLNNAEADYGANPLL